jgi:heme oxygenase
MMDNPVGPPQWGVMQANVESRPTPGLADIMREHTRALHVQAERSGFVRDLLSGRASRHGYAVYLRSLLPVYEALERSLDRHRALPGLDALARPALYRTRFLESDLRALCGAGWPDVLPLLPKADRYRARIHDVAREAPLGLAAHAYVRYLGDLNGGRILRALLSRSVGLDASALGFYSFPLIADLQAAKGEFRAALDAVGDLAEDRFEIVREAATAFRFNIDVSTAVHDFLTRPQQLAL